MSNQMQTFFAITIVDVFALQDLSKNKDFIIQTSTKRKSEIIFNYHAYIKEMENVSNYKKIRNKV